MAPRLDLQTLLEGITENVYFQPPASLTMQYPCIVYRRNGDDAKFAGNRRYLNKWRYEVMVIDRNPDSQLPDAVADLPLCAFDRHYASDGLNHDVFNLFY